MHKMIRFYFLSNHKAPRKDPVRSSYSFKFTAHKIRIKKTDLLFADPF